MIFSTVFDRGLRLWGRLALQSSSSTYLAWRPGCACKSLTNKRDGPLNSMLLPTRWCGGCFRALARCFRCFRCLWTVCTRSNYVRYFRISGYWVSRPRPIPQLGDPSLVVVQLLGPALLLGVPQHPALRQSQRPTLRGHCATRARWSKSMQAAD